MKSAIQNSMGSPSVLNRILRSCYFSGFCNHSIDVLAWVGKGDIVLSSGNREQICYGDEHSSIENHVGFYGVVVWVFWGVCGGGEAIEGVQYLGKKIKESVTALMDSGKLDSDGAGEFQTVISLVEAIVQRPVLIGLIRSDGSEGKRVSGHIFIGVRIWMIPFRQ